MIVHLTKLNVKSDSWFVSWIVIVDLQFCVDVVEVLLCWNVIVHSNSVSSSIYSIGWGQLLLSLKAKLNQTALTWEFPVLNVYLLV